MKHYIFAVAALAMGLGLAAPQPAQAAAEACIGCNCKIKPPGCANPTDGKGNALNAIVVTGQATPGKGNNVSTLATVNAVAVGDKLDAKAAAGYEPPEHFGASQARVAGIALADGNHNKSEIWGMIAAGKVDYSDPKSFGYADRLAMQQDVSKIAGFIAARQDLAAKLAANPRFD